MKGFGGIVNDFLSWSAFGPLSKLTYCCYLIHMNIIEMVAASTMASFSSDFALWSTIMYFTAILSMSLCVAALFTLCFEMPATRVEKLLVGGLLEALIGGSKSPVTRPTVSSLMQNSEVKNKEDEDKEELEEKEIGK